MKIHYHEMWNHTTSTINVPEKYQNPFNILIIDETTGEKRRPLTSLEILQNVLHGEKYKAEFEAVEVYMGSNGMAPIPQCLLPNVNATQELANRVVEARRKQRDEQERQQQQYRRRTKKTEKWPYARMMMPLPVLNVGYPKVGSSTIKDFMACIGFKSNHGQNGKKMFENLADGKRLYHPNSSSNKKAHAYSQLDQNGGTGYYPQISLLDELHEVDPDSTFVFNFRPIKDWIRSITEWFSMRRRMGSFLMPGLVLSPEQRKRAEGIARGKVNNSPQLPLLSEVQLAQWWCGHALHIREYVKEYPSHALVELDLYDTEGSTSVMYDLFQADTDAYFASLEGTNNDDGSERREDASDEKHCWGHSNKSSDRKKLVHSPNSKQSTAKKSPNNKQSIVKKKRKNKKRRK